MPKSRFLRPGLLSWAIKNAVGRLIIDDSLFTPGKTSWPPWFCMRGWVVAAAGGWIGWPVAWASPLSEAWAEASRSGRSGPGRRAAGAEGVGGGIGAAAAGGAGAGRGAGGATAIGDWSIVVGISSISRAPEDDSRALSSSGSSSGSTPRRSATAEIGCQSPMPLAPDKGVRVEWCPGGTAPRAAAP
jgi:hypothetical protein